MDGLVTVYSLKLVANKVNKILFFFNWNKSIVDFQLSSPPGPEAKSVWTQISAPSLHLHGMNSDIFF